MKKIGKISTLVVALLLASSAVATLDHPGTIEDLSAFTDENIGSEYVLASIKDTLVDKTVSMKDKVSYDADIRSDSGVHKV